jgi:hypothetical protein
MPWGGSHGIDAVERNLWRGHTGGKGLEVTTGCDPLDWTTWKRSPESETLDGKSWRGSQDKNPWMEPPGWVPLVRTPLRGCSRMGPWGAHFYGPCGVVPPFETHWGNTVGNPTNGTQCWEPYSGFLLDARNVVETSQGK